MRSLKVLDVFVLVLGYYVAGYDGSITYEYACQMCSLILVGYLLWRVETLSDLSIKIPEDNGEYQLSNGEYQLSDGEYQSSEKTGIQEDMRPSPVGKAPLSDTTYEQIGALLKQHCEGAQLYLQHGLTLVQLAQAIGSNRTYLDLYFSSQNTTYNTYINNLRILHFISLYREAVATGRGFTAQQLALDSGYRNYRTFSLAFRQRMGQSVTEWVKETAEQNAGNK